MIKPNSRFFRWIETGDDEFILDVVELIKFQNSNEVSVIHIKEYKPQHREKMTIEYLEEEYTELKPDGYITFSVVELGIGPDGNSIDDVLVTFIRPEDQETNVPYAICRQMITDLFANQLKANQEYYGISISKDSCPADISFNNFFSCSKILESEVISYYIGNTLDDIIKAVSSKLVTRMDNILFAAYKNHAKKISNNTDFLVRQYLEQQYLFGLCKTVRDLLNVNNFINDIYFGLKIIPLNIKLGDSVDNTALPIHAEKALSAILRKNITKSLVLKYDKDIDLSEIERDYTLIADVDHNIYIVAYIANGEYHIPVEQVETVENLNTLNSLANMRSVRQAYGMISMNNKYI